MGEEPSNDRSTPAGAVFLSYASEDAVAAKRIGAALKAAGIEVWLDQSELRGGDAWDQSIRRQIKTCALFLPIISKHTHERAEGYFRLEWKLAVDRSHLITAHKAFLVPAVIDDTGEDEEHVPDRFREVQWMRLPAGEASPEFIARVRQLLAGESGHPPRSIWRPAASGGKSARLKALGIASMVALAAAATYVGVEKPWIAKPAAPPVFAPPAHSIAVLPFLNMNGEKSQEYFSDGLAEELLDSLSQINDLQVAARTSSFSFKGKDADIGTIAHRLNVSAVLEGSVRRSGNTVRVTAQLINTATGFRDWSGTYDRDLGDVLKLQTEIASAVASALKVTLLGDERLKIERGGTHNAGAFDAYLRGRKAQLEAHENPDFMAAVTAYTEAIRLDPNYALAFANRSIALSAYAGDTETATREIYERAESDARKAVALAADLGEGHLALAVYLENGLLDFTGATAEYERARALAPGHAPVLRAYGYFAVLMGRREPGLAAVRRAVVLDPLNGGSQIALGVALYYGRENAEALGAFADALALDPEDPTAYAQRGLAYYAQGDFARARASCEGKADFWASQQCLAVAYHKLGRHADAERFVAKLRASLGDGAAYQYAQIYAQWGDPAKALDALDHAVRVRDPGVEYLKTDPLMDPLRQEPRFRAVMHGLKFPN